MNTQVKVLNTKVIGTNIYATIVENGETFEDVLFIDDLVEFAPIESDVTQQEIVLQNPLLYAQLYYNETATA